MTPDRRGGMRSRWAGWSAVRSARWERRNRWLHATPFVWRSLRRPHSRLLLRIIRLSPSLAVQLFPQLAITFHAGDVNRRLSLERAAPSARAIERMSPRPHHTALLRGDRRPQPAGSPGSGRMALALSGISHIHRRVTAHQPMELTGSRARREVASAGASAASRLLRRIQRHETEVIDSSSRALVRRPSRNAPIGEPAPVAPRSGLAAPLPDDRFSAPPVTAAPPMVNIENLTEQVMRQIDRRVTAWRERMGRA